MGRAARARAALRAAGEVSSHEREIEDLARGYRLACARELPPHYLVEIHRRLLELVSSRLPKPAGRALRPSSWRITYTQGGRS